MLNNVFTGVSSFFRGFVGRFLELFTSEIWFRKNDTTFEDNRLCSLKKTKRTYMENYLKKLWLKGFPTDYNFVSTIGSDVYLYLMQVFFPSGCYPLTYLITL